MEIVVVDGAERHGVLTTLYWHVLARFRSGSVALSSACLPSIDLKGDHGK
jgi:hypothetical protein